MTLGLVYFTGLVQDAKTVLPFIVQISELVQDRNPNTGGFSLYAKQA